MPPFRAQLHICVAIAAACLAHPAGAQTYPAQNITLQVAFAAGGIADVVARLVGQKLSERFGQTVVVENRGGAGGNLAAKAVSGAAPDGYTILATTTSLAVNETDCAGVVACRRVLVSPISSGFLCADGDGLCHRISSRFMWSGGNSGGKSGWEDLARFFPDSACRPRDFFEAGPRPPGPAKRASVRVVRVTWGDSLRRGRADSAACAPLAYAAGAG